MGVQVRVWGHRAGPAELPRGLEGRSAGVACMLPWPDCTLLIWILCSSVVERRGGVAGASYL